MDWIRWWICINRSAYSVKLPNGYNIRDGFTSIYNGKVLIHEIAHVLFNAHIFLAQIKQLVNTSSKLLVDLALIMGSHVLGLNAWERWTCGFIRPQKLSLDSIQLNKISI